MVMAQNQEDLVGAGDARRNGTCLKVSDQGEITRSLAVKAKFGPFPYLC